MNKKTGMAVATTMAFALGLSSMALADDEPIKVAYLTKQIANETWQLMVQGCIDIGREPICLITGERISVLIVKWIFS